MAIITPNQSIIEVGGKLNVSGSQVVQIVENANTATVSCSNWSTQNFLFSASITPNSASNKVLVYVFIPFRMDVAPLNWSLGWIWVFRGTNTGTNIMTSGWNGGQRNTISSYEKQCLDSPATTSAQTYSVYVGNYPSGTCIFNNYSSQGSDGLAYIRLTEISA